MYTYVENSKFRFKIKRNFTLKILFLKNFARRNKKCIDFIYNTMYMTYVFIFMFKTTIWWYLYDYLRIGSIAMERDELSIDIRIRLEISY